MTARKKLYSFDDHPEHKARLDEWAQRWIANALSTELRRGVAAGGGLGVGLVVSLLRACLWGVRAGWGGWKEACDE